MRRVGVALIPGEIQKNIFRDQNNITVMKKDKKDSWFTNAYAWPFGGKSGGGFGRRAHRLSPKAVSPIDTATPT